MNSYEINNHHINDKEKTMNRRDFNKFLGGIASIPTVFVGSLFTSKKAIAATENIDYIPDIDLINKEVFEKSEICDLFEVIDCTKEKWPVEFPVDFISYLHHSGATFRNVNNNFNYNNQDYVAISDFRISYSYKNKSNYELIKLINDDLLKKCWELLMSHSVDRNIVVYDSLINNKFSKRLVSLMKVIMRRNAGNNSMSLNQGQLTDLYLNKQHIQETKNWKINSGNTKYNEDKTIKTIFNVNLHGCDYLLEKEVIGLDLKSRDNLVFPIKSFFRLDKEKCEISAEIGIASLSMRKVLAGKIN